MKIRFEMIADPMARAGLESLDFDRDIAEALALAPVELVGTGADLGWAWTTFEYDEGHCNKVVGPFASVDRCPCHYQSAVHAGGERSALRLEAQV
jgi:hypothetical protein